MRKKASFENKMEENFRLRTAAWDVASSASALVGCQPLIRAPGILPEAPSNRWVSPLPTVAGSKHLWGRVKFEGAG